MAGSYDNEAVAIFALIFTFYLYIKVRFCYMRGTLNFQGEWHTYFNSAQMLLLKELLCCSQIELLVDGFICMMLLRCLILYSHYLVTIIIIIILIGSKVSLMSELTLSYSVLLYHTLSWLHMKCRH